MEYNAQKRQDAIGAFWPRRVSPLLTRVLVKTPLTPNQVTLLWGAISAANSYVIYRALTGGLLWIPFIEVIYVLCFVLDCVDGEIARAKNIKNPIGGKLLDGICHRATEYSLLGAYAAAAATLTGSSWVLLVAMFLMGGEAMYTYVYERRLTVIRTHGGQPKGPLSRSQEGVYTWGTPFSVLSRKQQLATITEQVHYKSIYALMVVAYMSGEAFFAAVVALAVYKHVQWVRLMNSTLQRVKPAAAGGSDPAIAAPVPEEAVH